jgi:hypothetical protein
VSWTGPTRTPRNLVFSHPVHARDAGEGVSCIACHDDGSGERMSVGPPRPVLCLRCHGDGEHLEAADGCPRCHSALSEVRSWSADRIAALPQPRSHTSDAFLTTHGNEGRTGTCATCHARESCERCHLNAAQLAPIADLARDARVAALVAGRAPRYFRPTSHGAEWEWRHGGSAASGAAACASCHSQSSCRACHPSASNAIAGLTTAVAGDARGVRFRRAPRVHAAGFETQHQARGATETACTGCHTQELCASCHAGSRDPEFHEQNFLARHGPESFGSEVQCSSCHNTELFCRSCHEGSGRSAAGRAGVVYHGATPLWLLGHGQAARQSLESCASCHAQSDCARCHSARGGWGVNPHGEGFAASRLSRQGRPMCLRCHTSASLGLP